MAIVRCPRCRDEVTVPPGATSRALVRCPLCLEQYLLSEALANAPPLLVIIGGEVPQAAIDQSTAEGHAVADGHDYQLAQTFAHSPDSHWGHAAAATLAPRATSTGRRARKREPNAVLLASSWIGGGALSLVLAPLILWWIFKKDPAEIGPAVAAYAPWIVPPQFHGSPSTTNVDSEPVQQPAKRRPKNASAKKPPEADRPSEPGEAPAASKVDDPSAVDPTMDSTEFRFKPIEAEAPTKGNETSPEEAQPKPSMPDLTDLLPK